MPPVVENPTLVKIGKKYGKSAAQVSLRWLTQRNIVVLPKSVTPSRILDNASVNIYLNNMIFLIFGRDVNLNKRRDEKQINSLFDVSAVTCHHQGSKNVKIIKNKL